MRSLVPSAFILSLLVAYPCLALDADQSKVMEKLEQKYFDRTYRGESDEVRAARVEKMIFGSAGSGDMNQRLAKLSATVDANDAFDDIASNSAPNTKAAPPKTAAKPQPRGSVTKQQTQASNEVASAPAANTETDTYPHVTALEQAIIGHTYPKEPLGGRLSRMEIKAFGAPKTDPDLSLRTDALDDYAENKLHKTVVEKPAYADNTPQASDDANTGSAQNTADGASAAGQSDYPKINNLEKEILGQTYPSKPLADRLAQMEVKAFGKASSSDDLGQRSDDLEDYAVKKLHKPSFEQASAKEAGYQNAPFGGSAKGGGGGGGGGSSLPKTLLSLAANSLMGMGGIGGVGGMGGMGMLNGLGSLGGGLPGGSGQSSMAAPGMGSTAIPGFGGIRARRRTAADVDEDEKPETRPEDPLVTAKEPPPPTARLLSKVGWCEVQVFGHTFSTMHLTARLGQLNRELGFEPGKKDVDLMDDVPKMIKDVQAKKIAGQLHPSGGPGM